MTIKKIFTSVMMSAFAFAIVANTAFAYTFPSTNALNEAKQTPGYIGTLTPYVKLVQAGTDYVKLDFYGAYTGYAFFEYRIDGEVKTSGTAHPIVTGDYIYSGVGVAANQIESRTFNASSNVEVRIALGGERDWDFDWTRFDVLYPRTAMITSPAEGSTVWGLVDFTAYLDDDDADDIQWAVRKDSCAPNAANNVFGNVTGVNDVADIDQSDLSNQTFHFQGDMTSMNSGTYCFIYNPKDDSDESDLRESVEFNLIGNLPTSTNTCKKGGWESLNDHLGNTFKNQGDCVSYVSTNGKNLGHGPSIFE